jgi:hypothetical protein
LSPVTQICPAENVFERLFATSESAALNFWDEYRNARKVAIMGGRLVHWNPQYIDTLTLKRLSNVHVHHAHCCVVPSMYNVFWRV